MRTQEEILARMKEREKDDPFGFERGDMLEHLTFENAKPYVKPETTAEDWKKVEEERGPDPVQELKDYMAFAWEKANDERGLSANRSIMHCLAWLWLAEEDELLAKVQHEYDENYKHYGKDILVMICEHFGLNWKQWDDGERSDR